MPIKSQGDDLKKRVLWLMSCRVAIVTLLMGVTAFIHLKEGGWGLLPQSVIPIYILVGSSYLVTLLSLIALKFIKKPDLFANIQIVSDAVLATFLIYVTGGTESIFSFLYIFVIIGAGTVYLKGAFSTASLSAILYGSLVDLQYYEIIPTLEGPLNQPQTLSGLQILYKTFMNISAFYIVAFLSSHLFMQIRRTRERLREKEIDLDALDALHKKIIQEISSGIMTVDCSGFITSFNRAAENITGYSFEEAYKARTDDIFPGLMEMIDNAIKGLQLQKGAGRWNTTYMNKGGELRSLGFSTSSMRGTDNEEVGSIIIFQDLTAYKEMEQAVRRAEKLSAVGQLAAGIAHEIRNPLASMSGSIQVLRDGLELDPDNRRLMDIILRETERLNRLITDFLEYARPYKPEKKEIDLSGLIMETLHVFEAGLPKDQGIYVISDIAPEVKVCGEQGRLKEVFWNLFNNSAQSMYNGGKLEVLLKTQDNMATATITDTGEGIEEKELSRIFEPFFTTKTYGTGLGLATVYRIVEAHDGMIRVESEKGRGTSFMILLPLICSGHQCRQ